MSDDPGLTDFIFRLQADPSMRDFVAKQMRKQVKRGDIKFQDTSTGKVVPPSDLDHDSLTIDWPATFNPDDGINIHIKAKDGRSLTGSMDNRGYLWKT